MSEIAGINANKPAIVKPDGGEIVVPFVLLPYVIFKKFLKAFLTNSVVAICPFDVPFAAVGAVGVPDKTGELNFIFPKTPADEIFANNNHAVESVRTALLFGFNDL